MGTFGDWKVACQDASEAVVKQGGAKKACGMSTTVQDEKSQRIGLTVMLRKQKKDDKTDMSTIQVITPVGVYLPVGIAVEIDGNAAGRLPYARCLPQFCLAFSEILPTTLEKLQKGTSANFIIYEAPGVGVPLSRLAQGLHRRLRQPRQLQLAAGLEAAPLNLPAGAGVLSPATGSPQEVPCHGCQAFARTQYRR